MKTIYLDNNATTMVDPEVFEEMKPFFTKKYGNPSSMHTFGGSVEAEVEKAREKIAGFLQVLADEIIFTSCGTESNNTAIRGVIESFPQKRHIVTSRVEHPAVLNVCKYLEPKGYRITELSVDREGLIDIEEYKSALSSDTALVTIMYANNETGILFPVEKMAGLAKEREILFHCDAVQAVGKIPVHLEKSPIDLLSISGHKLHAPKGVGVLYVRRGTRMKPLMIGGHQEHGRRAGTENVASIVGLGKACELAEKNMQVENTTVKQFRDKLEDKILSKIPDSMVNGSREFRIPNTTNISFEYIEGEAILLMLDQFGICASSGSACTSGSLEPSHVLRAMKVPLTAAHGSVRFSLSRFTTEKEIDFVIEKLPPIVKRLREISPFGKK